MGVPTFRIAPVCPISRDQAVPGMPGTFVPRAPRATDLPSAIATANALIQALLPRVNQGPVSSSSAGYGGGGLGQDGPDEDGGGGRNRKKRWEEKSRRKVLIKYYALDDEGDKDKDNWIIVERITYLKWHDRVQKVDFIFEWPYDPADDWEQNGEFLKSL